MPSVLGQGTDSRLEPGDRPVAGSMRERAYSTDNREVAFEIPEQSHLRSMTAFVAVRQMCGDDCLGLRVA